MAQQIIDWPRFQADVVYRGHVIGTVSKTPEGRAFLSRFAASCEDLPFDERLKLAFLLSIPDYTAGPPKVSAFPVFVAIGSFIARSGVTAGAIAGARWVGKNVLRKAWTAIAAGGWTGAGVAVGSFFAVDYVASKLQGEKAEIEKLYAAGRNIGGAVVESTTSIIHFLPALMIAAGVWFFLKQGKE